MPYQTEIVPSDCYGFFALLSQVKKALFYDL